MNIALDRLFASTNLNVFVPEPSFEFPPRLPTDEWLNTMTSETTERQKAFFGEKSSRATFIFFIYKFRRAASVFFASAD
jgi:hypothetical protein